MRARADQLPGDVDHCTYMALQVVIVHETTKRYTVPFMFATPNRRGDLIQRVLRKLPIACVLVIERSSSESIQRYADTNARRAATFPHPEDRVQQQRLRNEKTHEV